MRVLQVWSGGSKQRVGEVLNAWPLGSVVATGVKAAVAAAMQQRDRGGGRMESDGGAGGGVAHFITVVRF